MTTRETILNLLRSGPKTSWELTEGAKTSRYGGRIMELRRMGYDIRHSIRTFRRADGEAVVQHVYELISESEAMGPDKTNKKSIANVADRADLMSAAITRDSTRIGSEPKQGRLF